MENSKLIRIVLAEDHTLVRAGIQSLLANSPDLKVIAEAGSADEILQLIETHQPDVALLDVRMPGRSGLEVVGQINDRFPAVRVLMLSMHAEEEFVLEAMRAGARGYVLKDASPSELVHAVRAVARGEIYLSSAVAAHVAADYARKVNGRNSHHDDDNVLEKLSPRQVEILRLIGEGHSTKEIATILVLSTKTVDSHRQQLMERLNIHDIAGLVRFAIQHKLASLERTGNYPPAS